MCNDTNLDAPLPLIGLYITGACAICIVAMGIDTMRGLVYKKPWFPCKFFSFNAITLALLSVACKLPMDLSTRMPAPQDQLSKLSGTVFICVSMYFFMPSLGALKNEEIVANMLALFIFVITVVVNMSIQLSTGLIYKFRAENVVVLVCMLLLLGLMCFSAVAKVAAIKILEEQYEVKEHNKRVREVDMEHLKRVIPEAWPMAYTSNPEYVLARSSLSMGAGVLTCVCVLLLLEAEIWSLFTDFCTGQSSYQWAIWPVLISQTLAVLVGSVAPALRWLNAARMVTKDAGPRQISVERLRVKELKDWKENPLCPYFRNPCSKKIAYVLRNMMLDMCILLQKAFVQSSNALCLASARLVMLSTGTISCNVPGNCSRDKFSNDHVLHLPGDELILKAASEDMKQRMDKGKKEKRDLLVTLLGKSTESEGFRNMCLFSDIKVPPIPNSSSEVPLNCWTLPAVTLIAIAVSLSRFKEDRIKMMVDGLSEGLEMMKFVEKRWRKMQLRDARKAGEIVWSTIDINKKWLDCDLQNLPINEDHPTLTPHMQIIEHLAGMGKKKVGEVASNQSYHWSPKALAGNSLYRISRTILDFNTYETVDDLLDWMEKILADIVGKCLSRLPNAIFIEYVIACQDASETHMRNAVRFMCKADHLFASLRWSQPQVKPHTVEFTGQEFPGFPCRHAHNTEV